MYWANFLHLYQPPTQSREVLVKVTQECYRPLVQLLLSNPKARATLNINACLTEQLSQAGLSDVIEGLRALAQRGQVEFTGSGAYHPILPLIPLWETERQIRLNEEINRRYLGESYHPWGFFPPEMCYSFEVAQLLSRMGYQWIIVDELSHGGRFGQTRRDTLYRLQGLGNFSVFFRERGTSARLTYGDLREPQQFLDYARQGLHGPAAYLLSGTDGEIYGHHHPGLDRLLARLYQEESLEPVTISQLLTLIPQVETVSPEPASWSTWEDEMAVGAPYSHWKFPGNRVQSLQWQLVQLAVTALTKTARGSAPSTRARDLLDRGLHSCQFWWASCRPWWDTGMVIRGTQLLEEAFQVLEADPDLPQAIIRRGLSLAKAIRVVVAEWQETGYAQRLAAEFRASHPQVTSLLTFGPKQLP